MADSATVPVLLLPGLWNSGPEHWQSYWEREDPACRRVEQADWETPDVRDWVAVLSEAVGALSEPAVLVAHSSACALVAHWAAGASSRQLARVRGALLVAPSDPEGPNYPVGPRGFGPVPLQRVPFPTIIAASSNDPYVSIERATAYAAAWGSRLVAVGPAGHINGSSGLGAWPSGYALLTALRGASGAAPVRSGRPLAGEFADYATADIDHVLGDDAVAALAAQRDTVLALLSPLDDDAVNGVTYAPGKWTLKDVIAHLADDERIFGYRLLCLARRDPRALEGFDEQQYAEAAAAEQRPWKAILADYAAVRQATLTLLEGLPSPAWTYRGEVNGYEASVRGLAFHIAGHELRHLRAIETRYWPELRRAEAVAT